MAHAWTWRRWRALRDVGNSELSDTFVTVVVRSNKKRDTARSFDWARDGVRRIDWLRKWSNGCIPRDLCSLNNGAGVDIFQRASKRSPGSASPGCKRMRITKCMIF